MNGTRIARNISAALVAGIAAWSSYRHMVHIALSVGEGPEIAYLLPLSVDGMMVVASVAMVDDKARGLTVRLSAKIAFTLGIVASVGANVAAAHPHLSARIVAAWPAIALLAVVEMLTRGGKPTVDARNRERGLKAAETRRRNAASKPATPAPKKRRPAPTKAQLAELEQALSIND